MEECEGAAGVARAGAHASIIDAPAEKLSDAEFLDRVSAHSPNLIVLGVTFGSLEDDLVWAKRLKSLFPRTEIALRGAPCYIQGEEILSRAPYVEFCVRGDYELVFEQLIVRGRDAQGLSFRSASGAVVESPAPLAKELDSLPFSDRSTLKPSLYTVRGTRHPQATIHVQRGCPFPCTFCLVHAVSGNRARHRSPESIVTEVQQLQRQGISHFFLRAETFTLDRRWAIAVSEALAIHCPGVQWVTATRVECVDDEVISAMRAGGCYGISFGVDIASEEIGKRVKKMPQLTLAKEAMRLCDKHGVFSLAYIMIGFIWETKNTIAEAKRFIRALRPDLLTIHFAHPYPGTPYHKAVNEAGEQVVSLKAQSTPALNLKGLSAKSIHRYALGMLLSHYTDPRVVYSLLSKSVQRRRKQLASICMKTAAAT